MKIRIENHKICFRISDEEKVRLHEGVMLSTHLIFGDGILNSQSYTLVVSNEVKQISLITVNGIFEILFPSDYIKLWDDKKVGFTELISIKGKDSLEVIIEKDLRKKKK